MAAAVGTVGGVLELELVDLRLDLDLLGFAGSGPWPRGRPCRSRCRSGRCCTRWRCASSCAMCSAVMMSLLPVVVTKMSVLPTTSSRRTTSRPIMHACSAQIGSISVTATRACWPRRDCTEPLPTSPKPQDQRALAGDHDVGGAHDGVDERVPAAVDVVELALGDTVVDVDGREQERSVLDPLVETMHARRGLFRDAADRPPSVARSCRRAARERVERFESMTTLNSSESAVSGWESAPFSSNSAPLWTEHRGVAAVVEDQVGTARYRAR